MMTKTALLDLDRRVGMNIRKFRNIRGKSQTDLGNALGYTFQQIQKYEKGRNRVSASRLIQIADFLKCSTDDLLGANSKPSGSSDELSKLGQTRVGLRLAISFNLIENPKLRVSIVNHVARIAASV